MCDFTLDLSQPIKNIAQNSAQVFKQLPPIGWQRFILDSSQGNSTAFPLSFDTSATRLLAELPSIPQPQRSKPHATMEKRRYGTVEPSFEASCTLVSLYIADPQSSAHLFRI